MRLFTQEELQIIWSLFSQVGDSPEDQSQFVKEYFPMLFNEHGAFDIKEAVEKIKKEALSEFNQEIEVREIDAHESEEELLYLRFLQRDLLKPKGNHLLTFKRVSGIVVVGVLLYLALRGRFF